ncbi:MAG: hypothetical protein L7U72_15595 [Rubripirellula sp.]|nr:hypothetical protein [Rubripirellula sp.]
MDEEETLTAYHEAGHAVIGFALGGVVESLQLGGEHEVVGVRLYGDCRIAWRSIGKNLDEHLQREILTTLAGPAAEMVYSGIPLEFQNLAPWKHDLDSAWSILSQIQSVERKVATLRQLLDQLQMIIRSDRCWPAVAALADALLAHEFLEEEEVEEIIRFWVKR